MEPDRKRPQEGRFPVSARIRGPLPERLTHCPPRRFTNSVSGRGSPRFEVTSFLFGGCLCEVSEPYGPSGIPSGLRGSDSGSARPRHDRDIGSGAASPWPWRREDRREQGRTCLSALVSFDLRPALGAVGHGIGTSQPGDVRARRELGRAVNGEHRSGASAVPSPHGVDSCSKPSRNALIRGQSARAASTSRCTRAAARPASRAHSIISSNSSTSYLVTFETIF